MVSLRRARERHHDQRRKRDLWLTFYPNDRGDPLGDGFGALRALNEDRLPPGGGIPRHAQQDAEIVTYVREGTLAYQDSLGRSGVIQAGEFQRMTVRGRRHHSETNASRTDWAHIFQIRLRSPEVEVELEPDHEEKRFSTAERRGGLRVVASPDARRGSLRIRQDVLMYSAMLDPGQHLVHELTAGRQAWLHLVQGEVTLGEVILTTGDGVGVTGERAISLTARKQTEILLLDLPPARDQSS